MGLKERGKSKTYNLLLTQLPIRKDTALSIRTSRAELGHRRPSRSIQDNSDRILSHVQSPAHNHLISWNFHHMVLQMQLSRRCARWWRPQSSIRNLSEEITDCLKSCIPSFLFAGYVTIHNLNLVSIHLISCGSIWNFV